MKRWKLIWGILLTSSLAFADEPTETPAATAEGQTTSEGAEAEVKQPPPMKQTGPSKGLLRDAGRFKVEMISRRKGIEVYLLNNNDAKPLIEGSRLEGQLYVGKKEYELKFRPIPGLKRFHADWPDKLHHVEVLEQMNGGKEVSLVLLPTRERVMGAPVMYKLEKIDD